MKKTGIYSSAKRRNAAVLRIPDFSNKRLRTQVSKDCLCIEFRTFAYVSID